MLLEKAYHWVQLDKSMPVSALQVRTAVLINTDGSFSGLGPSNEGLHGPPMAIVSFLPRKPTKKFIRRVGWT